MLGMNYELHWLEIHHLSFYFKIKKPSKCFNESFSSNDTFTIGIVIASAGSQVKCGLADMAITRDAEASESDQIESFYLSDERPVCFNNILF